MSEDEKIQSTDTASIVEETNTNEMHKSLVVSKVIIAVLSIIIVTIVAVCTSFVVRNKLFVPVNNEYGVTSLGFSSAEDAVRAYFEGFHDADINRMMSTFAIKSYIENNNFEANLEHLRAYSLRSEIRFPNVNKFITSANIETRKAAVMAEITTQYIMLCTYEDDQNVLSRQLYEEKTFENEAAISEFTAQFSEHLNIPMLDTIRLIGFIQPENFGELSLAILDNDWGDTYLKESFQTLIKEEAERYGADELRGSICVFELNGKRYILTMDVINYGGNWYIMRFGGRPSHLFGFSQPMYGLFPLDFTVTLGDDVDVDKVLSLVE